MLFALLCFIRCDSYTFENRSWLTKEDVQKELTEKITEVLIIKVGVVFGTISSKFNFVEFRANHTDTVCVPYYKAAPYNISHTKIFSRAKI